MIEFDAEWVRGVLAERFTDGGEAFDRWLAEHDAEVAAKARGEALTEALIAHRDTHKIYGSTSVCYGGIGGQALTKHCAETCTNYEAHHAERIVWDEIAREVFEYREAVQS